MLRDIVPAEGPRRGQGKPLCWAPKRNVVGKDKDYERSYRLAP